MSPRKLAELDIWTPGSSDLLALSPLRRVQAEQWPDLDAGGCKLVDGRMHIADSGIWILYASMTALGCIQEVVGNFVIKYSAMYREFLALGRSHEDAVRRVLAAFADNEMPTVLWSLAGAGKPLFLLNLADPAVLARIGISSNDLSQTGDSDDRLTIAIGHQAYTRGWDGIIIPSIVPGETNVNLCLRGRNAAGVERPRVWSAAGKRVSKGPAIDPAGIGPDFRRDFETAVRAALVF